MKKDKYPKTGVEQVTNSFLKTNERNAFIGSGTENYWRLHSKWSRQ